VRRRLFNSEHLPITNRDGALLATASDLLFTGGREAYFFAFDALNGRLLGKAGRARTLSVIT
jgi:hypothetical protein